MSPIGGQIPRPAPTRQAFLWPWKGLESGPMPGQILIADGDPGVLAGLAAVCRKSGWTTAEAHSAGEVLALARSDHPDVCLLDLDLALPGLELLRELVALREAPAVVFLTSLADVATAVAAMRQGAADFLEKPVRRMVLEGVLERVLQNRIVRRERDRLREQVALLGNGPVVGSSESLGQLLALVERVAATPRTTVLIQGETGVGKELVARAIHGRSRALAGPVRGDQLRGPGRAAARGRALRLRAGRLHRRRAGGARGAAGRRGGRHACSSTRSASSPASARRSSCAFSQERVYRRVGSSRDRAMDARIIAATNRDLAAAVEQGRFREDLFYRLNVMSLSVPPLRARRGDIPELAVHFLRRFGEEFGKTFQGFTEPAMRRLVEAPWPGNVRELKNTIERAALLSSEPLLRPEHLVGLDRGSSGARAALRRAGSDPRWRRGAAAARRALAARRRGSADPPRARGNGWQPLALGAPARHQPHHALPQAADLRDRGGSGMNAPMNATGGKVAEFTLKAVLCGLFFGVLFGAANAYLGLKAGLTVSTSIPIAVLSVAVFRVLGARRHGARGQHGADDRQRELLARLGHDLHHPGAVHVGDRAHRPASRSSGAVRGLARHPRHGAAAAPLDRPGRRRAALPGGTRLRRRAPRLRGGQHRRAPGSSSAWASAR